MSLMTALAERLDGALTNVLSGLGTALDKSTGTTVGIVDMLDALQLEALYEGNDVARKIVEDLPYDCTRRWCQVRVSATDFDAETDLFAARFTELRLRQSMKEAHIWARVYGGGALVLGLDDDQPPEMPVDLGKLSAIRFARVATAEELQVITYDDNPMSANVGRPLIYQYTPLDGTTYSASSRIHHTRIIRFEGRKASPRRRAELQGWDISHLQTAWDAIQRYGMAEQGMAHAVHEYSIGVLRVKGLAAAVTGGKREAFMQRMADLNLGKSITRMLIVDQDGEQFERQTLSMTGLADAHDRFARSLCMAADMPASRLFGDAPGGLSTDNKGGRDNWNARVEAAQTHTYQPAILRIVELMRAAGEVVLPDDATVTVEWLPLSDTDPKEKAETEKLHAETDQIYWTMQAVDEMEIRHSRFGGAAGALRLMDAKERQKAVDEAGDIGGANVPTAPAAGA